MNGSTPEDEIHVVLHDLVFFVVGLDAESQRDLEELAVKKLPFRSVGRQAIGVARQLHGESGSALGEMTAPDILHHGAGHPARVDSPVLVKALVLPREECLAEVRGDFLQIDHVAVGTVQASQLFHVPVIDDGAFGHFGHRFHRVAQRPDEIKACSQEEESGHRTARAGGCLKGESEEDRPVFHDPVDEQEGPETEDEERAVLFAGCFLALRPGLWGRASPARPLAGCLAPGRGRSSACARFLFWSTAGHPGNERGLRLGDDGRDVVFGLKNAASSARRKPRALTLSL